MVDISDVALLKNLEDRLTAQLILTLEHSPKDAVLRPFLEHFSLEDNIRNVRFDLQVRTVTQEGDTIPDALIEGDRFLVYIESKLGAEVSPRQLERHFLGGKGKKETFFVLSITGGLGCPGGVAIAEANLRKRGVTPNVKWISWKILHGMFREILKKSIGKESAFLVKSLIATLEELNLVGFTLFEKAEIQAGMDVLGKYNDLLEKCNLLSQEVTQRLERKGIRFILFERDGRSRDSCDTISYVEYNYNKKGLKPNKKEWGEGSLAYYGFNFEDGTLEIGIYIIGRTIYGRKANWKGLFKSMPTQTLYIQYDVKKESEKREAESIEAFMKRLAETGSDKTITSATIFWTDDLMKMLDRELPSLIATRINMLLETLQKHHLYSPRMIRKRKKTKR